MDKSKEMTKEQILEHHMSEFSFSKLLKPYRDGGTENNRIERSIGLIIDWLVNKRKFPVEIAGAAILCTFMELYQGRTFPGKEGKYGSAGNNLDLYIAKLASEFLRQQLSAKTFKVMAEMRVGVMKKYIRGELAMHLWPRWKRIFKRKQWKKIKLDMLAILPVEDEKNVTP